MGILDYINKITGAFGFLAALLVIPLAGIVVYEIGMRFIFNLPTVWVYDVSWLIFGAMFLLGGAYTLREDRHVRVDIIFRLFPKKMQKFIELAFFLAVLLPMSGALVWRGIIFALVAYQGNEMLSTTLFVFPAWRAKVFIPIGFSLLFLQGLACAVDILLKKETK